MLLVQTDHGKEWEIQNYALAESEQLVDTTPPTMRPYAGAAGFVLPKWDADTSAWIEAATKEEIAAWESDHPTQCKSLEEEKAERIASSKDDLDAYLESILLPGRTDAVQYHTEKHSSHLQDPLCHLRPRLPRHMS
jgi:hypothetical protein